MGAFAATPTTQTLPQSVSSSLPAEASASAATQTAAVALTDQVAQIKLTDTNAQIGFQQEDASLRIGDRQFAFYGIKVNLEKPRPWEECRNKPWADPEKTTNKVAKVFRRFLSPAALVAALAQKCCGEVSAAVTNYCRRRLRPGNGAEYIKLEREEELKTKEILEKCWEEHKGDEKLINHGINSIGKIKKMGLRVPLNDEGEPDLTRSATFYVVIEKIDEKGRVKPLTIDVCTIDCDDPGDSGNCLVAMKGSLKFNEWEARPKYTVENLIKEIKEASDTPPEEPVGPADPVTEAIIDLNTTSNNCWLHALMQRVLSDKDMLDSIKKTTSYTKEQENKIKAQAENNYKNQNSQATGEQLEQHKNVYLDEKQQSESLRKCVISCAEKKDQDIKDTVDKCAIAIRKELGDKFFEVKDGVRTFDNQADPIEAEQKLRAYLDHFSNNPMLEMRVKKILPEQNQDTPLLSVETTNQTSGIFGINLSSHAQKPKLECSDLITQYFNRNCDETLKDYTPPGHSKGNYIVKQETISISGIPPNQISFHLERFTSKDGTGSKISKPLIEVPRELAFEPDKFVPTVGGNYKLKSAIIHDGDINEGHYYTLYKEGNEWFTYDYGTTTKIIANLGKTVEDQVNDLLKNAVSLQYEIS